VARAKPKKVFYNRRYKLPAWGQPYVLWTVVAIITLAIVAFTSIDHVPQDAASSLSQKSNAYAENTFYELRDAEAGNELESVIALTRGLVRRYALKVTEEKIGACKYIRLARGNNAALTVGAYLESEKAQSAFMLLTFLDRISAHNPQVSVEGWIYRTNKNCATSKAPAATVLIDQIGGEPSYDRIFHLKNLRLRRQFEAAFLMKERTLWANVLALLASTDSPTIVLPIKAAWAANADAMLAQNPLLKIREYNLIADVALYLGQNTQLKSSGLIAIIVLFCLLGLIPLANALGTFREKFDLGSAATSTVLYAIAFFAYLLLIKLVLHYSRADFAVLLIAPFLLALIFLPVRILQRNLLRAELNRAGLHALTFTILVGSIFVNPLMSLFGLALLVSLSAFFRATVANKFLRLLVVLLLFGLFVFATRAPLGSFHEFLANLLPAFKASDVLSMILLSLVGGNLVSLLFVPQERA